MFPANSGQRCVVARVIWHYGPLIRCVVHLSVVLKLVWSTYLFRHQKVSCVGLIIILYVKIHFHLSLFHALVCFSSKKDLNIRRIHPNTVSWAGTDHRNMWVNRAPAGWIQALFHKVLLITCVHMQRFLPVSARFLATRCRTSAQRKKKKTNKKITIHTHTTKCLVPL